MKRAIIGIILAFALLVLAGCESDTAIINNSSVDRIITGQISSIDRNGDYSIIYFDKNNLNVAVTTDSLSGFRVASSFNSIWTYNLHQINTIYVNGNNEYEYQIVSVSNSLPIGE